MPLTELTAFASANKDKIAEATRAILIAKGVGTSNMYVVEVDPATGNIPTSATVVPTAATAVTTQAEGSVLGTALTGVYQTVITPASDVAILILRNSCDKAVVISLNAGANDHFVLEAGEGFLINYKANSFKLTAAAIQAKHNGVVPTTGSVRVNVMY